MHSAESASPPALLFSATSAGSNRPVWTIRFATVDAGADESYGDVPLVREPLTTGHLFVATPPAHGAAVSSDDCGSLDDSDQWV